MSQKVTSLTLLILILALALRVPFLTREFVLEEGVHVKIARTLIETGKPYVYFGEQQELTNSLFRPPGLFLFMIPAIAIFGESEITARITPMIFGILEIALVIFFGRRLFGKKSYAPYIAGFFMAIHPYLIQTSLQVHYDQTYSFFSTLFLFLALDKILKKKNKLKDYIHLGVAFFLAFSIKYDPTLILIGFVAVFGFFYYKAFLLNFFITIGVSILTFFGLFYLYNVSLGETHNFWLPVNLVWGVLQTNFFPKATTFDPDQALSIWSGSYFLLIRFLSWVSIPMLLLFFYSFLRLWKAKEQHGSVLTYLALWILAYSFAYLAVGWAGDYPRYFAPIMAPFFLIIGKFLSDSIIKYKSKNSSKHILLAVVISLFLIIVAYSKGFLFLDHITGWIPRLQFPFFVILLLGVLAILFSYKNKISVNVLSVLIFLVLGQLTIQYASDLKSNYSLTNFYGTSGSKDAAIYLKSVLDTNSDVVFTYDPVAYYWNGQYYDFVNSTNKLYLTHEELVEVLSSDSISAFALPKQYYDELALISGNYGFDFNKFLSTNYRNYKLFGENIPTEVYYR